MNELNDALLAAHAIGDNLTLVRMYRRAGEAVLETNEVQGCFYLTQAYVFALEAGMDVAEDLRTVLVERGREA